MLKFIIFLLIQEASVSVSQTTQTDGVNYACSNLVPNAVHNFQPYKWTTNQPLSCFTLSTDTEEYKYYQITNNNNNNFSWSVAVTNCGTNTKPSTAFSRLAWIKTSAIQAFLKSAWVSVQYMKSICKVSPIQGSINDIWFGATCPATGTCKSGTVIAPSSWVWYKLDGSTNTVLSGWHFCALKSKIKCATC
jgi:hypothetical protein